ncbi:shikimate kinase, partial [bacterium]|nr:shikimate kinase [bacterium]
MTWIILIGQRACGKTSIGQELSQQLALDFVDLDHEIEQAEKKKISEIFSIFGEQYFRKLELQTLLSLPKKTLILSTGGGLVTQSEALSFLKQRGCLIQVVVSKDILITRRKNDRSRPLLNGAKSVVEELEMNFSHREKLYSSCSDFQVDCSALSLEESMIEIKKLIQSSHSFDLTEKKGK